MKTRHLSATLAAMLIASSCVYIPRILPPADDPVVPVELEETEVGRWYRGTSDEWVPAPLDGPYPTVFDEVPVGVYPTTP